MQLNRPFLVGEWLLSFVVGSVAQKNDLTVFGVKLENRLDLQVSLPTIGDSVKEKALIVFFRLSHWLRETGTICNFLVQLKSWTSGIIH